MAPPTMPLATFKTSRHYTRAVLSESLSREKNRERAVAGHFFFISFVCARPVAVGYFETPGAEKNRLRLPNPIRTAFHDSVHAVTRGRVMNPAAWKLAAG